MAAIGSLLPEPEPVAPSTTSPGPSRSGEPSSDAPTPSAPATTSSPSPIIELRMVTETERIPFKKKQVKDPSLPEGTREVRVKGRPGERTLTYEVTITNGEETGRKLVNKEVTKKPVTRVIAIGTMEPEPEPQPEPEPEPEPEGECHPSYTGACVPFASDVDCAGGSGNGPAYVRGPVQVVGEDVYGLDRDGDGTACEPD